MTTPDSASDAKRPWFEAYRVFEKKPPVEYRHAQIVGLVACLLGLLWSATSRPTPPPGPVALCGTAAGLELMLWGAFRLKSATPRTPLGRALRERHDRWFPAFLFALRHVFYLALLTALWRTAVEWGFPASWVLHALVFALLLIWPVQNLAQEANHAEPSAALEICVIALRAAMVILAAIALGLGVTRCMLPAGPMPAEPPPPALVLVWLPVSLLVAFTLIVATDRIRRIRARPAPRPRSVAPAEF